MTLAVERHVTGPFQENTYILRCPQTRQFAVVDPGAAIEGRVRELIETEGETLASILLTHAHLDHIWGLGRVADLAPQAPIAMHPAEEPVYDSFAEQTRLFGLAGLVQEPPSVREMGERMRWLREGETVQVGATELFVFEAPGHSPGSVCFYWGEATLRLDADQPVAPGMPRMVAEPAEAQGHCLVGDVVICGSVGRTDLPGSDGAHLLRTLRHRIAVLPPATHLLGGHCEPSRLEHELRTNPILQQSLGSA